MKWERKASDLQFAREMHMALYGETFEERVNTRVKFITAEIDARIPEIITRVATEIIAKAKVNIPKIVATKINQS